MKDNQVKRDRKAEFLRAKYGSLPEDKDENKEKLEKKWTDLKKDQIKYYEMCRDTFKVTDMTNSTLQLIKYCGDYLEFLATKSFDRHVLKTANFCKTRLCPTCAKRKSLRWIHALTLMIEHVNSTYDYDYLMLTLTAPNVKGDELKDELRRYARSFDNMFKRKKYKKVVKGFIRKLEITYNQKSDTYHPHYHVIIAVEKSYFKKEDYIKHAVWLKDWQRAMKDSSITQVDIRRIYEKKATMHEFNKRNIQSGIVEVAKYTAKSGDYLISQDVFVSFYRALKWMNEFTFGGCFKEAKNLFEQGELEHLISQDEYEWYYRIIYKWVELEMIYSERSIRLISDIKKADVKFDDNFDEMIRDGIMIGDYLEELYEHGNWFD